jgi:hypothetical protein
MALTRHDLHQLKAPLAFSRVVFFIATLSFFIFLCRNDMAAVISTTSYPTRQSIVAKRYPTPNVYLCSIDAFTFEHVTVQVRDGRTGAVDEEMTSKVAARIQPLEARKVTNLGDWDVKKYAFATHPSSHAEINNSMELDVSQ